MLGRAALLGVALALAACTERVLLDDLPHDAGPGDAYTGKDGPYPPPTSDACYCAYEQVTFRARTAQLIIALDRSAAMLAPFDTTTRWEAAADALLSAVFQYQNRVNFGYEQFPADPNDRAYQDCQRNTCCAGSVVDPGPGNYQKLFGYISCGSPQSSPCPSPGYDTASNAALGKVRDFVKSRNGQWDNDSYVLLVTAAEPSCSSLPDDNAACADATSAATELSKAGVGLVVLSVGYQPDPRSCLSSLSKTGTSQPLPPGTDQPYVGLSISDLSTKVNDFVGAVAESSCTLDTDVPPPSQAQLQVYIGNSPPPIPQVDSPDQNGWYYQNPSTRATITLAGSACDQFVRSQSKQLNVGYNYSTCGGQASPCQPWP